jgi:hypothetical protein
MAHAQKPDFVFRRNGRVHLNRRGASVQSTAGSRSVRISGSNAGYTMFRGSVKSTGYPFHFPPARHRVPSHFNRTLRTGLHHNKYALPGMCVTAKEKFLHNTHFCVPKVHTLTGYIILSCGVLLIFVSKQLH